MTFWRRRVNRSMPGTLSFVLEGETVVFVIAGECCRRCRRAVDSRTAQVVITQTIKPPSGWPYTFTRPVRHAYKVGLYHERCIPPSVFHAAAGSRPAPGRSRVAPADARVSPPPAARRGISGHAMPAATRMRPH